MSPQFQQFWVNIDQLLRLTLFKIGDEPISLVWLLKLILSLLAVIILSNLLKQLLRDRLLTRLNFSQGNRETISTLISYSLGAIGFLVVLAVNGLNLASLAVVLGGLGVGIGFGLQDLTKNLVSGLTLLMEGKLQVGDYIEMQGLSGYIKEIAMRATIIRTFDGGDVVVPNSNLISNHVLNWSYRSFTGKVRLLISVAYDSDPVLVTEALLNSAYMEPAVLHDPPPRVIFKEFGENALHFELWVWVNRIDEGITVKSSLHFIINDTFRELGIAIPFPQRDLWLRNPEALSQPPVLSAAALRAESNGGDRPMSLRQFLRQVPYFQDYSNLRLREIIEAGYRKRLAEGEILFQDGETATAFYIVLSGMIETISTRLNQCIMRYRPGEVFGEGPVMLDLCYIATARAVEETELFVIPKLSLEKLLRARPDLAEVLAQELAMEKETYEGVRQQLQELGLLNAAEHHNYFVNWVQTRLKKLLRA